MKRAALVAAVLALALTGCDDGAASPEKDSVQPTPEVVESGALVVCTETPYAPFVDEEDGEYTGFEIDLLRRMAEQLGLQLEIRPTTYAAMDDGSALQRDRCDVAAAALEVSAEREQVMDFTTPHYDVTLTLLRPAASDIDGLSDLSGRRLAVQEDSTAAAVAEDLAPEGTRIVQLAGDQYMFAALRQGRVDAVLQELPLNRVHTETQRFTTVESLRTGEQYAFAVSSSADKLRRSLDRALDRLRRDRVYQDLYDQYFAEQ